MLTRIVADAMHKCARSEKRPPCKDCPLIMYCTREGAEALTRPSKD
jgi:hypothetical protein